MHRPCHCRDTLFEDSYICASRVRLDTVCDGSQPCGADGIYVWFDGELYNKEIFGRAGLSDAKLLLEQHRNGTLFSFLQKADGIFAAVIYDQTDKSLTIVNDRYGLRFLYVFRTPAGCAWASELKAFRYLPSQSFTVDREAAAVFFSKGYLSGDSTWFRNIELLSPATVLTIKCIGNEISARQYWKPHEISQSKIDNDMPELARELGGRFLRAVERRCRTGEGIGVGLSGGLDSRAIFAAVPAHCEPVTAFTFGMAESADCLIARTVSSMRPSKHYLFEISVNNWLQNRADAVWWTDGQFNLLHMHGVEHAGSIREIIKVMLNGFQSDTLLGACYENSRGEELLKYPDRDRRFIAMGVTLAGQSVVCRIPFFDNDLMEFTMSIPLRYRRNSSIYHMMLLLTFPEYYSDIPWQRTNMPISRKSPLDAALVLAKKCAERLSWAMKIQLRDGGYTDYASWIRQPPAREFFTGLLTNAKASIFDFVDPAIISKCLERHWRGFNYAEQIGRYATFEMWLRRFYVK